MSDIPAVPRRRKELNSKIFSTFFDYWPLRKRAFGKLPDQRPGSVKPAEPAMAAALSGRDFPGRLTISKPLLSQFLRIAKDLIPATWWRSFRKPRTALHCQQIAEA
jgi:hypothetical protein